MTFSRMTVAIATILFCFSASVQADVITVQAPGTGGAQSTALANFYASNGFTINTIAASGSLTTAALAGSKMFYSMLPGDAYTSAEVSALTNYVSGGGHVFFMGDNGNVSGLVAGNNRINAALTGIGSSLQLANTFLDSNSHTATTGNGQVISHSLTAGVDTISYAAVSGISGVAPGEAFLLASDLTSVFGASEMVGSGRVTLVGDINPAGFISPPGNDNGAMFLNIANSASVPEPSTLGLLVIGAGLLGGRTIQRRKNASSTNAIRTSLEA